MDIHQGFPRQYRSIQHGHENIRGDLIFFLFVKNQEDIVEILTYVSIYIQRNL